MKRSQLTEEAVDAVINALESHETDRATRVSAAIAWCNLMRMDTNWADELHSMVAKKMAARD